MRIGLDVRAMQTQGGSAARGIGRYIIDIFEGLLAHAGDDRIVLLAHEGRDLPAGWAERAEVATVHGPVAHERPAPWDKDADWPWPRPWYLKIPKVWAVEALNDRYGRSLIALQRAGFERAVNGAGLDVLHLPTAVDLGSYPEGDFQPPVVATFLDAIPLVHRDLMYDTWTSFQKAHYDAQLVALRHDAHVVAISEASRQDAIRFAKVLPERTSVVYPSVSPAYGVPVDAGPARARYGLDGPFALFCSVPDLHKNPFRVVEAFARVRPSLAPGTRLAFISPLQEPYAGRIRDAARAHGLPEDAYTITGRIPEEDVIALFQAADLLVSPSLLEGFGLPAAQAITAGTPAIVSDRGSQPEVVGDAGLLVDPESVDAIADAMARILTDDALREGLAARGRARAAMFAPEVQARALRAVYGSVART